MRAICINNGRVATIAVVQSTADITGYDLVLDASVYGVEPAMGDEYDSGADTFSPGNDLASMALSIALSVNIVTAGTQVTATVSVRTKAGQLAPINNTYYAPVLSVDGTQERLLKVILTGGAGSISWTPNTPGIYTIDTQKIRPVPSARLGVSPELIVE